MGAGVDTAVAVRTAHDTLFVSVTAVGARATAPWPVPLITAGAAIVAGLLAQWFGAWLHARRVRRHLVAGLDVDLEVMHHLLPALAESGKNHGDVPMQLLAQMDMLLRRFDSGGRDLAFVPPWVRRPVELFYRELLGVRETLRLIQETEAAARRGEAAPVTRGDVQGLFQALGDLEQLREEAHAVARADHWDRLWLSFWVEIIALKLRVPARLVLWRDLRRSRLIAEARVSIRADGEAKAKAKALASDEPPSSPAAES